MNEKFIQNLDKLPADVRRQFALLGRIKKFCFTTSQLAIKDC